MSSHEIMNPHGGVYKGRIVESFDPNERLLVCQRAVGEHPLPGNGPVISVNRPVRCQPCRVVWGLGANCPLLPHYGMRVIMVYSSGS